MISDGIAMIFLEIVIIPVWASAYVFAYVNSFLGLRFCLRFGPSVYKKCLRTYNLLKGRFFHKSYVYPCDFHDSLRFFPKQSLLYWRPSLEI